jgi:hypothetical protein
MEKWKADREECAVTLAGKNFHLTLAVLLTCSMQSWVPKAVASGTIPDHVVDSNHTMEYLKFAATRNLLTSRGRPKDGPARLSSVSAFNCFTKNSMLLTILSLVMQSSLKKIMTMLGRVRRRQADDDPTIEDRRPAATTRSQDFYKALMVEAQHLHLEYVILTDGTCCSFR